MFKGCKIYRLSILFSSSEIGSLHSSRVTLENMARHMFYDKIEKSIVSFYI